MKHRILALVLSVLTLLSLAACSPKDEPSQPVDNSQVESSDPSETPNPMVEQADGNFMETLGFRLELPEGFTAEKYFLVGDEVAQMEVTDGAGRTATLRIAKEGTVENLSGVYGEFDEESVGSGNDLSLTIRRNKAGGVLAQWTRGDGYEYSLYRADAPYEGSAEETYSAMITALSSNSIAKTAPADKPQVSEPLEGGNPGTGLTEEELADQAAADAADNLLTQPDPGKPMEDPVQ